MHDPCGAAGGCRGRRRGAGRGLAHDRGLSRHARRPRVPARGGLEARHPHQLRRRPVRLHPARARGDAGSRRDRRAGAQLQARARALRALRNGVEDRARQLGPRRGELVPRHGARARPRAAHGLGRPRGHGPRRLDRHPPRDRHGRPGRDHPRTPMTALSDAIERYTKRNPKSAERARNAAKVLPGGNTRSVLHFDPFPLAFSRGEGPYLWSLDGDRYTDLLGEFTAGLYGHSNPVILDAIKDALDRGISYGGSNALEGELARLLTHRFPAMELVRFTNSGTEANLMALALALHHTGRRKILVFKGGYHGGVLAFGSGVPSPVTVPHAWVLGDINDVAGARQLIHENQLAPI